MYAIVESAEIVLEEAPISDIWTPIKVDTIRENGQFQRVYYVVDVEAFAEPIVVIPNLGAKHPNKQNPTKKHIADPDEYLMMTPRRKWPDLFEDWLKAPHKVDEAEMEEPEEETETEEEEEEEPDSEDEDSVDAETDEEANSEDEDEEESEESDG